MIGVGAQPGPDAGRECVVATPITEEARGDSLGRVALLRDIDNVVAVDRDIGCGQGNVQLLTADNEIGVVKAHPPRLDYPNRGAIDFGPAHLVVIVALRDAAQRVALLHDVADGGHDTTGGDTSRSRGRTRRRAHLYRATRVASTVTGGDGRRYAHERDARAGRPA